MEVIAEILNYIVYFFVWLLSKIASLLSAILFWSAEIKGFTQMEQIVRAWIIVRDFSNMIFIIIMLVIAFGTILKLESYSYKKLLGKMVLMAVLVNFSRTICGIMIDAAQVFMFTFLDAMSKVRGAGYMQAFGLDSMMSSSSWAGNYGLVPDYEDVNIFFSLFMAGAMLVVFCVITLTYIVMLILRAAMLWLLIILSPLAYVLNVLPATQSYAKEWWKKFTNYVILGPMIAFFLWIVMFVATYKTESVAEGLSSDKSFEILQGADTGGNIIQSTSPELVVNFIIAILLLFGGLQMTTSLATEFSKVTGKVTSLGWAAARFGGRRLDDIQNYGRNWLFKKGLGDQVGKKMEDAGASQFTQGNERWGRFLSGAGKALSGIGGALGTEATMRPGEIWGAFTEISDKWDKERMTDRRKNLRKGMANIMAPSRFAANLYKESHADQNQRDNENSGTVKKGVEGFLDDKAKELMGQLKNGKIDQSQFEEEMLKNLGEILGASDQKDIDAMKGNLTASIKDLEERQKDVKYTDEEKEDMTKNQAHLQQMLTAISGYDVTKDKDDINNASKINALNSLIASKDGMDTRNAFANRVAMAQADIQAMDRFGGALSWYAGEESVDNEYQQSQIEEAVKRLKLETSGQTEQVVNKLGSAITRNDSNMIAACLRSLWSSNDFNELHQSPVVMNMFSDIVRKKAIRSGKSEDETQEIMDDFEKNYTNPAYLQMLTQELLLKAFKGDTNAAVREDMRLGEISLEKAGGLTYGSSTIDGATGKGVFNEAKFEKVTVKDLVTGEDKEVWKARTNNNQLAAFKGKTANLNTDAWAKTWHPNLFISRTVNGGVGEVTDQARQIMRNFSADMFLNVKGMRNDLKKILASPNGLKSLFEVVKQSKPGEDQNKAMAFLMTAIGTSNEEFTDKQAARFGQNLMKSYNSTDPEKQFNFAELENVVNQAQQGNLDAMRAVIERIGIKEGNTEFKKRGGATPPSPST